jgi:hypothetical protein
LLRIIGEESLTWPHAMFEDDLIASALFKKLGFNGIPHYLVINKEGVLVSRPRIDQLSKALDQALYARFKFNVCLLFVSFLSLPTEDQWCIVH